MTVINICVLLILVPLSTFSQTADVTKGCAPLRVTFEGVPGLNAWFWDFGDSGQSTLQDPEHIFLSPGEYDVVLKEGPDGEIIGTITISVYPEPEITLTAEPTKGCSPLDVQFTSQIEIHDSIEILSYLWSFGDGDNSTMINPAHTYAEDGSFLPALEVKTSIPHCDKTVIIDEPIEVESPDASFSVDPLSTCDIPAEVTITNTSPMVEGAIYEWDFDNGATATGFDPGTITYTEGGRYLIRLKVIYSDGCESNAVRVVTIGPPFIQFNIPDTICFGDTLKIENTTTAILFEWTFHQDATPSQSNARNPEVIYPTPGIKTIDLSCYTSLDCVSDTTIQVFVEDPDPGFTLEHGPYCLEPIEVTLTANDANMASYLWNGGIEGGPEVIVPFNCPEVDSFHIFALDTIHQSLVVTSAAGCKDTSESYFLIHKPDAFFVPTNANGCAPLAVVLSDFSNASNEIVSRKWLYGDGNQMTFVSDTQHTYVYTEPGEYYVHLIIETIDGCVDTSEGTLIEVGEPIFSQYNLSSDEICLGDSITIEVENLDDRIDGWHVTTDNGRFKHCWTGNSATHQFVAEPGTFDVEISIDYNGCIANEVDSNRITVNGAKADIAYMINCETPNDVMFNSESLNAGPIKWTFSEQDSSTEEMLTYHYDSTGNYIVYLEAVDEEGICPVSTDSAEIFIRNIEASFDLPERVCDNFEYELDASQSVDVDNDCSKGYLWYLANSRPREVDDAVITNFFTVLGPQEVTLIVEDINGCTDTLTRHTTSYGIDPMFEMDKDRICLPGEVSFTDMSTGDTTLIDWDWSFGGTDPEEVFTFQEETDPGLILVQLTVGDAVGCRDSLVQPISVYEPYTNIFYQPGPQICVGDTINFSASDFTQEGSFLHFNWDFGILGQSTEQNPTLTFPEPGFYPVDLDIEEDATGCENSEEVVIEVGSYPEAEFISNFDGEEYICYPEILTFINTSQFAEGQLAWQWHFPGNVTSDNDTTSFAFGKGTHEVTLVVTSQIGCADTLVREFTLVGPEGSFEADETFICEGIEVGFNLVDTVDVTDWEWDFGDGSPIVDNEDPVTHTFHIPTMDSIFSTNVSVVLSTAETGCEAITSLPVTIYSLDADFNAIDTNSFCTGRVMFENLSSELATQFYWDFGDGNTSTDENPTHDFTGFQTLPEEYTVTLIVTDEEGNCTDSVSQDILVEEIEQFHFIPNVFSPNGDGTNDNFNVVTQAGFEEALEIIEFKVYNRWGNLVYDNDDPANGWDGTYDGEPAPSEVYAYYIEYRVEDCISRSQKGNITLIR